MESIDNVITAARALVHGAAILDLGFEDNPYRISGELMHNLIDAFGEPDMFASEAEESAAIERERER